MGSQKDVMELFVERDLRRIFSEYDGWKITPASAALSRGGLYQISRSRWVDKEVAFVAVSFDQVVSDETNTALDTTPNGSSAASIQKYLLVPQAANTWGVPPHIRTLSMSFIAFAEGSLIWLTKKKNAKKFIAQNKAAAA